MQVAAPPEKSLHPATPLTLIRYMDLLAGAGMLVLTIVMVLVTGALETILSAHSPPRPRRCLCVFL